MNIILKECIENIQETKLNEIIRVCEEWLDSYNLQLTKEDDLFVLKNELGIKEVVSEDINDILDYIADLIKIAMEKAEFENYLNMAKDYEIITGNNLVFSLCISETCKECNGINVTCLNNNLYKCNHTNNVLYKSEEDTLIHIDLLNSPKWIKRAMR